MQVWIAHEQGRALLGRLPDGVDVRGAVTGPSPTSSSGCRRSSRWRRIRPPAGRPGGLPWCSCSPPARTPGSARGAAGVRSATPAACTTRPPRVGARRRSWRPAASSRRSPARRRAASGPTQIAPTGAGRQAGADRRRRLDRRRRSRARLAPFDVTRDPGGPRRPRRPGVHAVEELPAAAARRRRRGAGRAADRQTRGWSTPPSWPRCRTGRCWSTPPAARWWTPPR